MGGNFSDCFEIVVDPDAEPVDWDDAVAEFLLTYVRRAAGSLCTRLPNRENYCRTTSKTYGAAV